MLCGWKEFWAGILWTCVEFDYRTERAGTYSNWIHLDRNQEKLNKSMATQFFTTIARADLETICFLFHCHKKNTITKLFAGSKSKVLYLCPKHQNHMPSTWSSSWLPTKKLQNVFWVKQQIATICFVFFYFYVVTCYPNKEQLQNGFTA